MISVGKLLPNCIGLYITNSFHFGKFGSICYISIILSVHNNLLLITLLTLTEVDIVS